MEDGRAEVERPLSQPAAAECSGLALHTYYKALGRALHSDAAPQRHITKLLVERSTRRGGRRRAGEGVWARGSQAGHRFNAERDLQRAHGSA